MIGVVQEQHAQRARLYKQWKQYNFPIAQDALTSLGLAVVPVPILLDEFGFVVESRPRPSNIAQLVAKESPNAAKAKLKKLAAESLSPGKMAADSDSDSPAVQIAIGDRYFFENSKESVETSIRHYRRGIELCKSNPELKTMLAAAHFRLGVAYRTLFDQSNATDQKPEHFSQAALHWTKALSLNPNQYIWRRRIQQYGPRQIKPYPFYSWVETAVSEIKDRGETPVQLNVSLTEAEIAMPQRKFQSSDASISPDPDAQINRDIDEIIKLHTTVVPQSVKPGETVRIHLRFSTDKGHWNNEAEPMQVWIDESQQGKLSKSLLSHKNARTTSSDEVRNLEVDFQTDKNAAGTTVLKGFALYYVCKTESGQCLFRRQNFEIPVEISADR